MADSTETAGQLAAEIVQANVAYDVWSWVIGGDNNTGFDSFRAAAMPIFEPGLIEHILVRLPCSA
ncbi:MAG: hypothetical protein JW889_03915 [Verrucomicrobia bacterium]|nr:hypothetical protein [Verrucomicrobiota bacterium]